MEVSMKNFNLERIKELEERMDLLENEVLELRGIKLNKQSRPLIPCFVCHAVNCKRFHIISSPL